MEKGQQRRSLRLSGVRMRSMPTEVPDRIRRSTRKKTGKKTKAGVTRDHSDVGEVDLDEVCPSSESESDSDYDEVSI